MSIGADDVAQLCGADQRKASRQFQWVFKTAGTRERMPFSAARR
jgi:hypothetical protein